MNTASTGAREQKQVSVISHERIVVFDFDGTVSLGHGPVRSYARIIANSLPADQAIEFLGRFETELASPGLGAGAAAPIDGYDLVRLLAEGYDVPAGVRSSAYLSSRLELATAAAPVIAPTGLAEFLADARPKAHLVLATNAPSIRIEETLVALGLAGSFDAVHTSVGKPAGFGPLLDELLASLSAGTDAAAGLLSIGDVWANDLAPAHDRGATTALVGGPSPAGATPTFRATHLYELYPALQEWLDSSSPLVSGTTSLRPAHSRKG
jgi:FMN phosphatase YigB (HAD superfamily)